MALEGFFSKNLLFNSITRFDISQSMIDNYFRTPDDEKKIIQMEGGRLLSGVIEDLSTSE